MKFTSKTVLERLEVLIWLHFTIYLSCSIGGGTGTGNPLTTAQVAIVSAPYQNNAAKLTQKSLVSDFQFCVTKLKLKIDSIGATDYSIELNVGLLDLSESQTETLLGQVELPHSVQIDEMKIEIHRDPEACQNVDFSMRYEGTDLKKDLEFRFIFEPALKVTDGDTLTLAFDAIASALERARLAGKLNDQDIGSFLNNTVYGTGTIE